MQEKGWKKIATVSLSLSLSARYFKSILLAILIRFHPQPSCVSIPRTVARVLFASHFSISFASKSIHRPRVRSRNPDRLGHNHFFCSEGFDSLLAEEKRREI